MGDQKAYISFILIINVMLGTGPLIVPAVFLEAGPLLSILFGLFMGLISLLSGLLVLEALSLCNAITIISPDGGADYLKRQSSAYSERPINSSLIESVFMD